MSVSGQSHTLWKTQPRPGFLGRKTRKRSPAEAGLGARGRPYRLPRTRMDIGSIIGAAPLALGVLIALGGILVTVSYLSDGVLSF